MDEELQIQSDLQRLSEQESARKKRERRRENERKQREIVRMQLHMTAPTEIGLNQTGPNGESAMFNLRPVDRKNALEKVVKSEMSLPAELEGVAGSVSSEKSDIGEESDEEQDQLDRELDSMYDLYQERKAERSANYRAKKARKEHEDGEWEGFSGEEGENESDGPNSLKDSSDDEFEDTRSRLISTLGRTTEPQNGLTARANHFFCQDLFKDIGCLEDSFDIQGEAGTNTKRERDMVMVDAETLENLGFKLKSE